MLIDALKKSNRSGVTEAELMGFPPTGIYEHGTKVTYITTGAQERIDSAQFVYENPWTGDTIKLPWGQITQEWNAIPGWAKDRYAKEAIEAVYMKYTRQNVYKNPYSGEILKTPAGKPIFPKLGKSKFYESMPKFDDFLFAIREARKKNKIRTRDLVTIGLQIMWDRAKPEFAQFVELGRKGFMQKPVKTLMKYRSVDLKKLKKEAIRVAGLVKKGKGTGFSMFDMWPAPGTICFVESGTLLSRTLACN